MPGRGIIIAIDGIVGAGKTTTARLVAAELGYRHLDTGAMYRALTLTALRRGIPPEDRAALAGLVRRLGIVLEEGGRRIWCDGEEVTEAIRQPEVARKVGAYADVPLVRQALVRQQQELGAEGGIVAEGRDTSTVVFPDAQLKIRLVAALEERACRRYRELTAKGVSTSLEQVTADIRARDQEDARREYGVKCQPPEVLELDTTGMTIKEQVSHIVSWARQRGA